MKVYTKYKGTLNLKQVAASLVQAGGNKAAAARAMCVPISTFKRAAAHLASVVVADNNTVEPQKPVVVDCSGCGEKLTTKTAIYLDAINNRSEKPVCQRCYESNIRAPTRPKHIVCMPHGPYSVADRRRKGTYTHFGAGDYD